MDTKKFRFDKVRFAQVVMFLMIALFFVGVITTAASEKPVIVTCTPPVFSTGNLIIAACVSEYSECPRLASSNVSSIPVETWCKLNGRWLVTYYFPRPVAQDQ